jgi:hypothetical protein
MVNKKKVSKSKSKISMSPPQSSRKSKTRKPKGKKVCEIFKTSEGKTIKTCGIEEQKPATKDQIKHQNKLLKNFFIGIGVFILVFVLVSLYINSMKHFEYEGIKFNVIKEGDVIFYHTFFPIVYKGKNTNYNVYLRNDPRKLKDIPFKGDLNLLEMMVINSSESLNCEGYGNAAIINLQQILGAIGTGIMKDPNATCDIQGRYGYLKIQPGDLSGIGQFGPACYLLQVNNCEILEVTERFLIEALVNKLGN